jgi:hypothetical protein
VSLKQKQEHRMGQYQQWLHYREVEQQLQTQLETLKQELLQLQAQAHCLERQEPEAFPGELANPILYALAAHFTEKSAPLLSTNTDTGMPRMSQPTSSSEAGSPTPIHASETMSSALFRWSNLPNFGAQQMPLEAATNGTPPTHPSSNSPLSPIPHSDMALLPEDMPAFFDQHTPTEPRIELPHWFRNLTTAPGTKGPIDQESIRNNRLVQRWVERWRKQPPGSANNRREPS